VQQVVQGVSHQVTAGSIPDGWMGVDIGPETIVKYTEILLQAKTIVWNGPMGIFEMEPFDTGTRRIAQAIARSTEDGGISIVGGGDSAAAVSSMKLDSRITHISTGGGASLQMLEGKPFSSVTLLDDAV
jgi:phosphoglycerate kinase